MKPVKVGESSILKMSADRFCRRQFRGAAEKKSNLHF